MLTSRSMRQSIVGLDRLALFTLAFTGLSAFVQAGASEPTRRVFVLEGQSSTNPAGERTFQALQRRLQERSSEHIELFFDALELGRVPGQAHEQRSARFLGEKYAQMTPDVLVAISRGALRFILQYRDEIGRHIPIVYCCTSASAARTMHLPPEIRGVVSEFDWPKTLALAAHLQPGAKNLVIISGASDYDKKWEEDALRDLLPQLGRYAVRRLRALPVPELLSEVSRLSPDTIVLMLPVFVDGAGKPQVPPELTAAVAKVSGAPLYSPVHTHFGKGIVGGYTDTFEDQGVAVADLVFEILAGRAPSSLPAQVEPAHSYLLDAREVERWKLSASNLPPGSQIMFKTPSLWEQHRTFVLTVGGVFVAMVTVLSALLVQMLSRKRAEASLRASEDRLTFTAASTNTGLWEFDVRSRRLWATAQCRAMLGLHEISELKPKTFLRVVHPGDRSIIHAGIQSAWHGDAIRSIEFRILYPDGRTRWMLASNKTHFDTDGKPCKVSGVMRDVTARKNAEREAELLSERLSTIQEEERSQIAQELHDSTAQQLVAASLTMMGVRDQLTNDPAAQDLCNEVQGCLEEATKELRTYTYLLHAPQLEKNGLPSTLSRYVDGFAKRTGLKAKVRISHKVEQLSLSRQRALLRVIQEALANVYRHAAASEVSVNIKCIAGQFHVLVTDNGKGIDGMSKRQSSTAIHAGVGIPGMTARLRRLGGDLVIHSKKGGTTLHGVLMARKNDLSVLNERRVSSSGAAGT